MAASSGGVLAASCAQGEHQPGAVAVRLRAAVHHPSVRMAEPGRAYAGGTVRRGQRGVSRSWPWRDRADGLHGQGNQQGLTATQFALFTSFIAVPRTVANASTGFIVEAVGWTHVLRHLLHRRDSRHAVVVKGGALDGEAKERRSRRSCGASAWRRRRTRHDGGDVGQGAAHRGDGAAPLRWSACLLGSGSARPPSRARWWS